MAYKILVLNTGSTSTKMAVYIDEKRALDREFTHSKEFLEKYRYMADQLPMRRELAEQFTNEMEDKYGAFDAIVARGGILPPIHAGGYEINETMVRYLLDVCQEEHASNVAACIAFDIKEKHGIPHAYIYDGISTDELEPLARISGIPGMARVSVTHCLNMRATAHRAAREMGRDYKDCVFIAAHLGGGISVGAHCRGRVVDVNNALGGEGPFTPERAGTLPAMQLVELCFSGRYTLRQVKQMVCGRGGLAAWLGSNDMITISARAEAGEEPYKTVVSAMMYAVAKQVGSMYVALGGKADYIIVTGGIAHSEHCVGLLRPQVDYMAPVVVMPGENEMLSLAFNALGALRGELEVMEYTGADCRQGMVMPVEG